MNKSIQEIEQIIIVLTSSNRNGHLVATKNDGTECCSIVFCILGKIILSKSQQHVKSKYDKLHTNNRHTLLPDMKSLYKQRFD